jgi:hypothetical protein
VNAEPFKLWAQENGLSDDNNSNAIEAEEQIDFPLTVLPPLMQQLATSCSEVYRTGVELPAVAALTVLAAAIGKQVISTGAVNGRETPANLYTVISAPSGFGKAVANIIARPMTDANAELIERYQQEERPMHRADVAEARELHKKTLRRVEGRQLNCFWPRRSQTTAR